METQSGLPGPTDEELVEIEAEQQRQEEGTLELDALMNEAMAAIEARANGVPRKASKRERPAGLMRLDSLYKDPDNWNKVARVKIVHEDGTVSTLVGDFLERHHKSVRGARWLTQLAEPNTDLPARIEYVRDRWYIEQLPRRPARAPDRELHFTVTLALDLEGGFSAGAGTLQCCAIRGEGIARAELGLGGARFTDGRSVLYLPAGLDVLEGLTREAKLAIKAEFDRLSS